MKTLIAYASKGGATEEYARAISDVFKKADVVNLRKNSPDVKRYRNVIVGTGIRMGRVYREALRFLVKDFDGKRVALFISSLEPEKDVKKKYVNLILKVNPSLNPVSVGVFGGRMKILWKTVADKTDPEAARKWAQVISKRMKS
jgi:menaquinone-dependent protoporphyrinogen IX oxidase